MKDDGLAEKCILQKVTHKKLIEHQVKTKMAENIGSYDKRAIVKY